MDTGQTTPMSFHPMSAKIIINFEIAKEKALILHPGTLPRLLLLKSPPAGPLLRPFSSPGFPQDHQSSSHRREDVMILSPFSAFPRIISQVVTAV
jgi:hypothetical protein